jgi:thiol-disulfide isomerase/thioredoxin
MRKFLKISLFVLIPAIFGLSSFYYDSNHKKSEKQLNFIDSPSNVPIINFNQYQTLFQNPNNDSLLIVNFWATWCKPCVEEMPSFEQIQSKYNIRKVKVIFLSQDFTREIERVRKFISDKKIKSCVYLLNAGNPNDWIDKVDSSWSGAIPVTVFYRNGKKVYFHEGQLSYSELEQLINSKI